MISLSSCQTLLLVAICSVFCSRTLALPAISAYPDIRSGSLDEDGDDEWTRDPSLQDLEAYKLLYELANTVERPSRHADGLFTSGYSKLLGQLSAKEYLESLLAKRVSDELGVEPVKRHSDAVFTDNYSRYRKQMAAKKYLNSVLAGKRRQASMLLLHKSLPEYTR
ncbi:vasoactive intestinal peptide b [Triplophysa dalaica]|uniref:vasoactive intestinal peptide b n=1 Tax=Triplophysa dalaica TaxID=1582913 RepID=UPI0024DFDF27|nr:vasoactive intestinal peptide b [Triplophysa dalaica]